MAPLGHKIMVHDTLEKHGYYRYNIVGNSYGLALVEDMAIIFIGWPKIVRYYYVLFRAVLCAVKYTFPQPTHVGEQG